MLTNYIQAAMRHAEYETLEDGTVFGRIPGFQGVWANAPTLDACREELQEVLEDWILVGLRARHRLPVVEGIDLNIADVA
jgi:predicted RNase H-like HicB family nuclease